MKQSLACFLLLLTCLLCTASPITLELKGGSTIRGEVLSWDGQTVAVKAEFGTMSFKRDQLSEKTVQTLLLASGDTSALQAKIGDLEAQVEQLKLENAQLKQAIKSAAQLQPVAVTPVNNISSSATATSSSGMNYTISSTGKRHNAGCRYYSVGRACGPTTGVACKICGG